MNRSLRFARSACAGTADVIVIGAGHCGLAMSRCLAERGIEHVVLERGRVANSWRRERWPSLRLLTPNWQSRLPGFEHDGADPDGFMTMPEVIAFINAYAERTSPPVLTGTAVTSVRPHGDGYCVATSRGAWRCRAVVIASGACNVPNVPAAAAALPASTRMLTPREYGSPADLEPGGVLVVGASATGLQLADEIHRSGRPVTLAVGEHIRMPRVYRGRDIQAWMHDLGLLDQRYDEVEDIGRARRLPSPQLVGSDSRRTLDLNALTGTGVRIVGRLVGVAGGRLQFSGSLRNHCAMADLKLGRLLDAIDEWAAERRIDGSGPPERPAPTRVPDAPALGLELARGGIRTVVWATGFRPDYGWLDVPVLDRKGRLRHEGGVVAAPGLYAMGLPFMRRRKSTFIHGAEDDARELSAHLHAYLDRCAGRNRAVAVVRARGAA